MECQLGRYTPGTFPVTRSECTDAKEHLDQPIATDIPGKVSLLPL